MIKQQQQLSSTISSADEGSIRKHLLEYLLDGVFHYDLVQAQ